MKAKESFLQAYRAPTPTPYYREYAPTRLSIAEYGAALTLTAVDLGIADGPVVDIGCGYGTLGALLRTECDIEEVYASYLEGRKLAVPATPRGPSHIVGIDVAPEPLEAALRERLIDEAIQLDLNQPPTTRAYPWQDAIAVCCAVLGYVQPRHLAAFLHVARPRLAIITCVTWLQAEFLRAFRGHDYRVVKLNRQPLFQRWATVGEEARMEEDLIEGAHRSDCFALSMKPIPLKGLQRQLETVRAARASNRWLAAGRPGGCELAVPDTH